MQVQVHLTDQPIAGCQALPAGGGGKRTECPRSPEASAGRQRPPAYDGVVGAWTEFRGLVRGEENGQPIAALEYEAYPEMALR